ncbi:hypothetical protein GOP47_0015655 [Adiantum capillus-veneris]|uniref:BHLH domain-containing protein n=1 Tax=Adiantum capillus-veneris TaxID=13818 RepID=A0A9D4ZBU8_ADICA|nr:hypothetical protein GOP47_0015655 [Adiantum capillus-veneris]
MSGIADDLAESLEVAGAGEALQRSVETGAGERQALHGAGAGEKQDMRAECSGGPAFNGQNSNLVDSDDLELLSWLQYPVDDAALQYLPPLPSSPVLTSVDLFPANSLSLPTFSSSSAFSSSLASVKHLPQVQNEAFTGGKVDLDPRATGNGWFLQQNDVEGEFWPREQIKVFENQQPGFDNQRLSNKLMEGQINEASLQGEGTAHRAGGRKARDLAPRLPDIKQEFATDSLSKLAAYEERKKWALRENSTTNFTPHPSRANFQSVPRENRGKEPDINCMLPTAHIIQGKDEGGSVSRQTEVLDELVEFQSTNAGSHIKERPLSMKDVDMMLKERVPFLTPTERLQAHPGSNAALALGAGRAAGTIGPAGVETFSRVRTSLQPNQPYNLPLGCPSPYGFNCFTRTLSGNSLQYLPGTPTSNSALSTIGSFVSHPYSQQRNDRTLSELAQIYYSKPVVGFSEFGFRERLSKDLEHMGTIVRSNVLSSFAETATIAPIPDPPMVKPKEFSKERVVAASSGGSQTSGSLRETASGNKRKLEDLDGQSEEAEGDSGLSSLAKSTTPKSPRTNDLHNLSERRRRNRINDKMNALRELIPNASKSNKAALLDEAIDYLRNLQFHLQVLSSQTGISHVMPMLSMPHMGIRQYGSLHAMRMGNNNVAGGPALAAGGSSVAVPFKRWKSGKPKLITLILSVPIRWILKIWFLKQLHQCAV